MSDYEKQYGNMRISKGTLKVISKFDSMMKLHFDVVPTSSSQVVSFIFQEFVTLALTHPNMHDDIKEILRKNHQSIMDDLKIDIDKLME